MKSSERSKDLSNYHQEKSLSPLCMPDLPLPTPPPMANIMMTSRFDLQTRGGCGYRRILSSRSAEFRSPLLGRANFAQCFEGKGFAEASPPPLPRHRNLEDLSANLDGFADGKAELAGSRSKYLSRDSVLSEELEEVQMISREISCKFNRELSPEYQSVFYNDHYISDIDENEEIKEFLCGYKTPERRLSDHSDRTYCDKSYTNTSTLPASFSYKTNKKYGHVNSAISSNYYIPSPVPIRSTAVFDDSHATVFKNPQKTIVKIAKIRVK
ncbi:unnamed protein product [Phyllotreta striolata]|uniref:Uncharacterized protein n=1 Tax=Phyllotreta striolata TaxID=444603 RepID=A0A9N9TUD4_PHYSR|nr:unnamed protein product [Phyllotreta striolata]